MEEKTTILRKAESVISMPTKIKIGDPMYFENGEGLKHTYSKLFRGKKDWVCFLEIIEDIGKYQFEEFDDEPMEVKSLYFKLYLSCDEELLSVLKRNRLYTRQKVKTVELGVDTASYILGVSGDETLIRTGGDGGIGYVSEYYTKTKLEAVVMEIALPCEDDEDYKSNKKILESLFKCNLSEVEVC